MLRLILRDLRNMLRRPVVSLLLFPRSAPLLFALFAGPYPLFKAFVAASLERSKKHAD